eukprot:snap_masked-scaffold_64-processed-gene-0.64-mRNA-1 protein AED:1.00 eAED:1.00 QI:0/0/0/0/1/1/3/0/640
MTTLSSITIEQQGLVVESERLARLTKLCLRDLPSLVQYILRVDMVTFQEEKFTEIQALVDTHPSLVLFEVCTKNVLNESILKKKLHGYVKIMLHCLYGEYQTLNECQVLFLGDGRVGKTSTIRNLFKKRFRINNDSTLVLNDIDIFSVNPNNYEWASLSKYELSVQRVKNILPKTFNGELDLTKEFSTKYKLDFEEELLYRTISDDKFVEGMKTNTYGFSTADVYFRVSDFGGQQIFSSVHPIFLNSNALYFVVFNMVKTSKGDLQRLKFWCESILQNAPKAKVILVGTFLQKYKRKFIEDQNLHNIHNKIVQCTSSLSAKLYLLKSKSCIFFPIDNSQHNSREVKIIKRLFRRVVSGSAGLVQQGFLNFAVLTSWVLFLDSCREEANLMSVKQFGTTASRCGFDLEEIDGMLEVYSKAGLICYLPNLDLNDYQNFIFFAPSYLAQALGKFIRDPSFHELAFRMRSNNFHLYRRYVDSGKISRELFDILLREYTEAERTYVLQVAIRSLVLIPVEIEKDMFIVPELIPVLMGTKIQPSKVTDIELVFQTPVSAALFVKLTTLFQKEEGLTDHLLYMGFARFIFGTEVIVDLILREEKVIGLTIVQGENRAWLIQVIDRIKAEIPLSSSDFDVITVYRTEV